MTVSLFGPCISPLLTVFLHFSNNKLFSSPNQVIMFCQPPILLTTTIRSRSCKRLRQHCFLFLPILYTAHEQTHTLNRGYIIGKTCRRPHPTISTVDCYLLDDPDTSRRQTDGCHRLRMSSSNDSGSDDSLGFLDLCKLLCRRA